MRTSRWLMAVYATIIFGGIFAVLPNLFTAQQLDSLPGWFPRQQVSLGLDLRGGAHLVLEVDAQALRADRLQGLLEDARDLLQQRGIPFQSAQQIGDALVVTVTDATQRPRALEMLRTLSTPGLADLDLTTTGDRVEVRLTDAWLRDRLDSALAQSVEIVRQRVDQIGVTEPTIQRIGSDRIVVQLAGVQDPSQLKELLGSTAKMTFHRVVDLSPGLLPPAGVSILSDDAGMTYAVEDRVALDGDRLIDARAGFDPITREPVVNFRLDGPGARQFAEITTSNVGRPFAIVLDGRVLSAPVINEPILGGSGQISGNFTVREASLLSAMLRAGALPVPLKVIEERTVGPDLGSDIIQMGLFTGLAGFLLVVAMVLSLYRGWGMIANLALGLNVVLTLAALTFLGAKLTLPGIAGIILGMGLAVDANILINERIREELRRGKSAPVALQQGFQRAYSTIVDANVTSLIVTALLFLFGTGPVRGFAITMMLGIGISMFTAITLVRILMSEIVRRRKLKTLRMEPLFRLVPENTSYSFMRARFLGIGVSIVLSIASIVLFIKPGLNYGIDFTGGIQVEVTTSQPADVGALRSHLAELGLGEVTLQTVDDDYSVLVRVQRQPGGEEAQTAAVEMLKTELLRLDTGATIDRTDVVGPKVSGELAESGMLAVLLASVAMLLYIWWRFEWHFAVGAIATLVLDTTKTIGFFALTGLDFNLTAIAALLTIIGYSVNDKVVVYDRMRENLKLHPRMPLRELIDLSINQVLTRCIYTSLVTFLCMLPMAIWGGSAVQNFAIPMVFGIVVATTSSIFIAAPILLLLGNWWQRRQVAANVVVRGELEPEEA